MTILVRLENHYRECGILSTDFRCKHECECRRGAPLTPESAMKQQDLVGTCFTQAKSAFVGVRYGNGVPRLLFVSSDPGATVYGRPDGSAVSFASAQSRTPAGVQNREKTVDHDLKISSHWKWTHEITRRVLCLGETPLTDVTRYFAHANAAKCIMNKDESKEADSILFKNCLEYLRGEINILAPSVVITQGGKAKRGAKRAFHGDKIGDVCKHAWIVKRKSGGELFWWHMHHPSSFGARHFKRQREGKDGGPGLDGYIRMIREFISNRDSISAPTARNDIMPR